MCSALVWRWTEVRVLKAGKPSGCWAAAGKGEDGDLPGGRGWPQRWREGMEGAGRGGRMDGGVRARVDLWGLQAAG